MNGKNDKSVVCVKRLSISSVLKLHLIGLGIPVTIFCLIAGILAVAGYGTVKLNGQPVHGLLAIPVSFLIGVFVSVVMAFFVGGIFYCGLWIFSFLRPLKLEFLVQEKKEKP